MIKRGPTATGFRLRSFRVATLRDLLEALGTHIVKGEQWDIVRENPPLKSLAFPLSVGTTWTYRPQGKPFRIDKIVEGTGASTVEGQIYPCSIVLYLYDINADGVWENQIQVRDYVGSNGLLRRRVEIKDMVLTTNAYPDSAGLVDFTDEYVATSVPSN